MQRFPEAVWDVPTTGCAAWHSVASVKKCCWCYYYLLYYKCVVMPRLSGTGPCHKFSWNSCRPAVDLRESIHVLSPCLYRCRVWQYTSYRNWGMCPKTRRSEGSDEPYLRAMFHPGCLACLQWAVKPGHILGLAAEWKTEARDSISLWPSLSKQQLVERTAGSTRGIPWGNWRLFL